MFLKFKTGLENKGNKLLISFIFFITLFTRFFFLDWGFPFQYHPDEYSCYRTRSLVQNYNFPLFKDTHAYVHPNQVLIYLSALTAKIGKTLAVKAGIEDFLSTDFFLLYQEFY